MSQKFVVGYDGSDAANRALNFALEKAKSQGASVVIAHVLEWSPYSFLTPTELEERHMRRKEELQRAEEAIIKPIVESLSGKGVEIETDLRYGHIADTLCEIAKDSGASQIFIGRQGHGGINERIFGSVAGGLAQASPVACTIVP